MASPPPEESTAVVSGESPPQEQQQNISSAENLSQKLEKMNITTTPTFSIWPPTQRTRDAVINRLIETLSTPSVLSKRYGSMPHDEASTTAKSIEEEAYNAALASSGNASGSVDEGLEILQVYSKEISKRMLEAVKSKAGGVAATSTTTPPSEEKEKKESEIEKTGTTEEVDNESSSS